LKSQTYLNAVRALLPDGVFLSNGPGDPAAVSSLPDNMEVIHINLNNGCIEGLRHRTTPIFSIQYHVPMMLSAFSEIL
jgi:carbamoylphosphate synthase small subunit